MNIGIDQVFSIGRSIKKMLTQSDIEAVTFSMNGLSNGIRAQIALHLDSSLSCNFFQKTIQRQPRHE